MVGIPSNLVHTGCESAPKLFRVTATMPTLPEALAIAWGHYRGGRFFQAEDVCRQILRVVPGSGEAWFLLGVACLRSGKLDDSVAAFQQCLQIMPGLAEAHGNLGSALARQGRIDEAIPCFEKAASLKPELADPHANLAKALLSKGRLDEAVARSREALRLNPDHPEARLNLGHALQSLGQWDEAIACYRRTLELRPDYPEAHWSDAMAMLLLGDFRNGWVEYEWRWKCQEFTANAPRLSQPLWDGTPRPGQTILLYTEQGLGDTLHFIRYAPLLKQRCGTLVVQCQKALVRVLETCAGIDRIVAEGSPLPAHDLRIPLLSLPRIFETTLETVPSAVPYLSADPQLVERWGTELGSVPGFRIGIAWEGNRQHPLAWQRFIPLSAFQPLAGIPGVRVFSLQKGAAAEDLSKGEASFPIINLGPRLDETTGPFQDTAAVLRNLDLVITCDTALGHLAGALAVPVWVAHPFAPDWRWMLDREDTPWYPTMRLFRQTEPGNWAEVFERIAVALEARVTDWGNQDSCRRR